MRIAILTLPLHTNYGGILQCYALQTVLQRMGHEVEVLSKPRYGVKHYMGLPLLIIKNLCLRNFGVSSVCLTDGQVISYKIDLFIKKHIKTRIIKYIKKKDCNKYEMIVVGSDQVWRPSMFKPIEHAFLSFAEDVCVKKISYAASFGVDYCEYTENQIKRCSFLLKNFNAVSVREISGIELCNNYFGVNAVQTLDPTLLLTAEDYRRLINKDATESVKGKLVVYILDRTEEKINLVNRIAADRNLIPFWLDSPDEQNKGISLEKRIKMSVEQWLRAFDDAEFVFTDSFHGCVFSIIFKKQFIVLANNERGVCRIESLLDLFSIRYNLIFSEKEYIEKKEEEWFIDFEELNKKLAYNREGSLSFLMKACV